MKKICFLMGNYFKYFMGGAELQAYFIAKKLAEDYKVHYLFVRYPGFKIKDFQRIDNGIIKLLSIQGLKISPNEQLKFKPAIRLDRIGSNTLEFVLMNRIGRTLRKEEKKVSVY